MPYVITLLIIAPFLLLYSKSDIHLWLNQYHSTFFDCFFRVITFLGNGTFLLIPGILLLFYSLRSTLYLAMAYLCSGLVAQILKRFVFEDCVRPLKYFQNLDSLHLVEGVPLLSGHSFPSGHATSAFAMFLCLAMIGRNRYHSTGVFYIGLYRSLFKGLSFSTFSGGYCGGIPDRYNRNSGLLSGFYTGRTESGTTGP